MAQGYREKAQIEGNSEQDADNNTKCAAERHARTSTPASNRDAIEEKHDLGAFAQHGDPAHAGEGIKRPRTGKHVASDPARRRGKFPSMAAHPDIVPPEHGDGSEEDGGIEQLLANAFDSTGDLFREEC